MKNIIIIIIEIIKKNPQAFTFMIIFAIVLLLVIIIEIAKKIIPQKWINAFSVLIMKIAEKYISTNGNYKMDFCIACIKYIFSKINIIVKIETPTDKEIQDYLQNIFNKYSEEINAVKNIVSGRTKNSVEKVIKEITETQENEKAN